MNDENRTTAPDTAPVGPTPGMVMGLSRLVGMAADRSAPPMRSSPTPWPSSPTAWRSGSCISRGARET